MSMLDARRGIDSKPLCDYIEDQASALDGATIDRLNRDRRAALAQLPTQNAARHFGWMAAVAIAGLGVVALLPLLEPAPIPPAPVSMETFTALASPSEADLIESLDFYLWAETQDGLGDDQAG